MDKHPSIIPYWYPVCICTMKNLSISNMHVLCYEKQDVYSCAATDTLKDMQGYTEHFLD